MPTGQAAVRRVMPRTALARPIALPMPPRHRMSAPSTCTEESSSQPIPVPPRVRRARPGPPAPRRPGIFPFRPRAVPRRSVVGTPGHRPACHHGAVVHPSASASALLHHVRTGRARSRAELVALTGASRNTGSARGDQLIAANLLEEGGRGWSTGGRPPTLLRFNSRAGCVLAVDLGVTSVDVAVTDLSAQVLATVGHPIDIADGPGPVLAEVDRLARQVLAEAGLILADVCAVGVGVPGPGGVSAGGAAPPPIT